VVCAVVAAGRPQHAQVKRAGGLCRGADGKAAVRTINSTDGGARLASVKNILPDRYYINSFGVKTAIGPYSRRVNRDP
jgi:hypothetical protein